MIIKTLVNAEHLGHIYIYIYITLEIFRIPCVSHMSTARQYMGPKDGPGSHKGQQVTGLKGRLCRDRLQNSLAQNLVSLCRVSAFIP